MGLIMMHACMSINSLFEQLSWAAARHMAPLPYPNHPNAAAALKGLTPEHKQTVVDITYGPARPAPKFGRHTIGGSSASSSSDATAEFQTAMMQCWQAGVVSTVTSLIRDLQQAQQEPAPPEQFEYVELEVDPPVDPVAAVEVVGPDPVPAAAEEEKEEEDEPPRERRGRRLTSKQAGHACKTRNVTHSMRSHYPK